MPTPPPPTLQSDTVVFTHAKLPSRQTAAAAAATRSGAWASDAQQHYPRFSDEQAYGADPQRTSRSLHQQQLHHHQDQQQQQQTPPRVAAAAARAASDGNGPNIVRMTVRVMKQSQRLGFGIRHDTHRKLRVSTLQGNSAAAKSPLRVGDILLSVNGVTLDDLSFLEVIQHLKATRQGELVFHVERDLNASPNHVYEYPATDLETGEESYIGDPPSSYLPPPAPIARASGAADTLTPTGPESGLGEPQQKRARHPPPPASIAGIDIDVSKMEKTHKQVVNSLVMELKKEKAERATFENKNNALRKRLQTMLIECDEVRVKASIQVAAVKESAKRVTQQLEKELAAARAQLRLQDRGPSVARTDSIMNDLITCKAQLDRAKRIEADRSAQLSARFNLESRHSDREAHRVREKLISLFRAELRQVGKRSANPAPTAPPSASASESTVSVVYEGIRRLAFLKLFGFPHDFDQYTSPEFCSLAQIHRSLAHDEFADLFGNALSHEERTGIFIVALAPMDVAYDPSTERLSLVCGWTEQNTIRELARNFRF